MNSSHTPLLVLSDDYFRPAFWSEKKPMLKHGAEDLQTVENRNSGRENVNAAHPSPSLDLLDCTVPLDWVGVLIL